MNRRSFLTVAAAATVALATPGTSVAATTTSPTLSHTQAVNRIYLSRGIIVSTGIPVTAPLAEHLRAAEAIARRTQETLELFPSRSHAPRRL